MKKIHKLTWQQLESAYPPFDFSFKTTDDLECLEDVIGQERAKKAMEFGLSVKAGGYNIYISGEPGTGKMTLAKLYTQKVASKQKPASDWCYVYNFKDKRVPKALCFDAGDGKSFRNDLNELIAYLTNEIPYLYLEKDYQDQKTKVLDHYQNEKELLIKELKKHSKALGFAFRILEGGISLRPLDDEGQLISEQAFEELDAREQNKIENSSKILQEMAQKTIDDLKDMEAMVIQEIEDLAYQVGLENVGYYIKDLKEKYANYHEVVLYLDELQHDILENIEIFIAGEEEEENPIANLLAWKSGDHVKKLVSKYDVNLLVDNSENRGAPVIVCCNATYRKIIGELEYDNELGALSTDYMKIKAGLLHAANGGYLILKAEDLLSNYEAWGAIKQALKTKQVYIENPQGLSIATVASLKPEPIPISLKVILTGDIHLYHLLYDNDLDFKKLFRIRADFETEMANSQSNTNLLGGFIKTLCQKESLLPLSADAVKEVLRYAIREGEHQKRITTEFSKLSNIVIESSAFAALGGSKLVEKKHVQEAIEEKRARASRYEEKLEEQIIDHTVMIQTKGSAVGEINALTVYDTGEYRFGQPVKITATTYKGKSGIIHIEKEAKLSGPIHTKGTQVGVGYLGQTYAQETALSLTCRICFEQNYNKVDGDSASSAELYSMISSLSDLPIKQNIAVTGSVNQHGVIQPVGGVTHKIEGFFRICKKRGLTGDQGVIIPDKNIAHLVLDKEVIEAVKNQRFHIYAISKIEEGLEILTGKPYDQIQEKVALKLEKFNKTPQ